MVTLNGMQNAHHEFKEYLKEKNVDSLFSAIIEHILLDQPDDPIRFIATYLRDEHPHETQGLYSTVTVSRTEKFDKDESSVSESEDSDSDEQESDDFLKPQHLDFPRLRRDSICAEKMCPNKSHYEVTNIQKSEKELALLEKFLLNCVLFDHLDKKQFRAVQDSMFKMTKIEGDVIIKQGDDGDNYYVIESGNVDVYKEVGEGSTLVNSYGTGDSFGELAIMYNAPRAATCIGRNGPVKLWALDRVTFKAILMKSALEKRDQHRAFLCQIPIFAQMTEREVLTIIDALREESFSDGTVVFEEGAEGDKFYIIKQGGGICTKKSLSSSKSTKVAHLARGSYFGEVALITTKKRQATVTAIGRLECLSLDKGTFQRVMGPLSDILSRNMETYNKFQSATK